MQYWPFPHKSLAYCFGTQTTHHLIRIFSSPQLSCAMCICVRVKRSTWIKHFQTETQRDTGCLRQDSTWKNNSMAGLITCWFCANKKPTSINITSKEARSPVELHNSYSSSLQVSRKHSQTCKGIWTVVFHGYPGSIAHFMHIDQLPVGPGQCLTEKSWRSLQELLRYPVPSMSESVCRLILLPSHLAFDA